MRHSPISKTAKRYPYQSKANVREGITLPKTRFALKLCLLGVVGRVESDVGGRERETRPDSEASSTAAAAGPATLEASCVP